jgi:carbon-monoxide dehydrogenase small subunit
MRLEMTVNGTNIDVEIEPYETLADVLRERLGLTGTKIGCREGECGSCTVLIDGEAVNSCVFPAAKVQSRTVLTIEGIGTLEQPHPLQTRIAELGAAQCGYCTPGIIMSAFALLSSQKNPSLDEIKDALVGNLCRCTGYSKIIRAVQLAIDDMNS